MGNTDGREQVLRELVRHRSALFAMILSIVRDFALAEEVMQEVAVVVCDQWADFRTGTSFQAWAMRIARNKIHNLTRAARKVTLLSPEALDAVEKASAGESRDGWLEAVHHCLESADERSRALLSLRYRKGLGGEEISRLLSMTIPAVHMALSRARTSISRCVQGRLAEGGLSP